MNGWTYIVALLAAGIALRISGASSGPPAEEASLLIVLSIIAAVCGFFRSTME